MLRRLFYGWYGVGLALMLTVGVPPWLAFSNGLFLVFYALYALELERRLGGSARVAWLRAFAIGCVTFAMEALGVRYGWPFGEYAYTAVLGFSLQGVPLAIACAWVGVLLNALLLSPASGRVCRALLTGLWLLALDLVLDPVADARALWVWSGEGGYYGVPFSNFASWFALSAALSLLFPIRPVPAALRREALRLMQSMLLMFGLLAWKEGMTLPLLIAALIILLAEGGQRYDACQNQSLV